MHRDSNREITGIELERYYGREGNRTREWFASNGFRSSMTTIRPKKARKVHYNRFEGDLARCSIYDLSNNKILSDESVVNGGTYQLIYYQGIYILNEAIPMRESRIELPKIQETTDLSREVASLKESVRRLESNLLFIYYLFIIIFILFIYIYIYDCPPLLGIFRPNVIKIGNSYLDNVK